MADHVDPSLQETLKKFAKKVNGSSTKERIEVLQEVAGCAENPDFPDNAVKGIFVFLNSCIGHYRDNKSRQALLGVVRAFAKAKPEVCLKCITHVLEPQTAFHKKQVQFWKGTSGDALFAFSWTCIFMQETFLKGSLKPEAFQKLVNIQCGLVYGALSAGCKTINKATLRKLASVLRGTVDCAREYGHLLEKMDDSMCNLSILSLFMEHLNLQKHQQLLQRFKDSFIDVYIKQLLTSRTKPPVELLKTCNLLLKHCTHADFSEKVLPAAKKAMLRNPEIALESLEYLIQGLSLDLGNYVDDLVKPLGTQLCSKDATTRDEAASAFRNLAMQCSDTGSVEKILNHLFGILNGSEGKLSVADQRISVLTAIGNVSLTSATGMNSLQSLAEKVTEKFIPLLQTEVHEGTLVHSLSMLSLWCAKFYTNVPTSLMQWFKKGVALKTSTSAVRNAYIQCMNASFHGDTLVQGEEMIIFLNQTLDKAIGQPSQLTLVVEAVSAACVLVKFTALETLSESKMATFWKVVMEQHKQQLFLNDRILSSVSDDVLCDIVALSEKLLVEFPAKMTDKVSQPFYKAIIYCLTHKSWPVRKSAESAVKHILGLLGGIAIALSLLAEFDSYMRNLKLVDPSSGSQEEENQEVTKQLCPWILVKAAKQLTMVEKVETTDAEALSKAVFVSAHHPNIVQVNESTWTDILYQLHLDAAQFITNNKDHFLGLYKQDRDLGQSEQNALKTLCRICPEQIVPQLMDYVKGLFSAPALVNITQDEYGIFLCPEGELYNKELMESFQKANEVQESNVKRESKLYSYKEQMAAKELQKELDRKRGKTEQQVKLTKKQEEQLQATLQKETQTRTSLKALDEVLQFGCHILRSLLLGNTDYTCRFTKDMCAFLVPLLYSPLGAPQVSKVFLDLGLAVFGEDKSLGNLVSHVTLRSLQPVCDICPSWSDEPIAAQMSRVVKLLYNRTCVEGTEHLLTAPCLAFVCQLLQGVLKGGGALVKGDVSVEVAALHLIEAHAQRMRREDEDSPYDPSLLPSTSLLRLLLSVLATSTTQVSGLASSALVEVARCLSGQEGCARASSEDIRTLLQGLLSPSSVVRDAALQALLELAQVLPNIDDDLDLGLMIAQRVWVASYDSKENVAQLANRLREELYLEEPYEEMCAPLVEDITCDQEVIRLAASRALEKTLESHGAHVVTTIQLLKAKYEEKLYVPPTKLDNLGRVMEDQPLEEWYARSGVALALKQMAPLMPADQVSELFEFFVPKALGDRVADVRSHMRDAALAVINQHGNAKVNVLLPLFEDFLANAADTAGNDAVRQSIVILMGSLAKHLDKDNPKVKPIVAQLIGALSTPSQEVQEAVAHCLPPLVPGIKPDAPQLVQKLMVLLLDSDNYGERRGAAYGLAGLTRGLGITALKQLDIMNTLENAVKDKKNPRKREGALFAYEMLCTMLGKLFEPYVVQILPHLLLCFGDSSQYVREAADFTAKAVMSMLTAHGVKMVLPCLLKGIEEEAWRTKAGAVELLGAMAYCAPKQLSACLPSIVPKLTEVLTDSHVKVQKAGAQALKMIGDVIKNPEIQAIVPQLIDALQEPSKKTMACLQTLLATKFIHFIDAPSLALIMPVVERAFADRVTETRKMAAQIIGNMYSLTDQKDLDPYIEKVIPGLKQSLLDPVPEVRTVSARALGAMMKGMGEAKVELLNWLMQTLQTENSSVDRSGAAQGLSEVIGGLGLAELDRYMPQIISTAERNDIQSHVRDGYIMMYIYLPSVFQKEFMKYIGPIIPSILKALADEAEFVRDTALKAGQRIINMYADTAIELLLPELENGLFDDNWRIRYSSVQLLGDLLYRISGVTGKMTTETAHDDDNFGTESSQKAILHALGRERRDRVLAGLYMGRSDTAIMVRQSALHVWKVIVTHTPQTLREILPVLFTLLLGCLATQSHDKRQVAARTFGDLVKKLGERVLPEIIPILEKGLESDRADQRQGVCVGLTEIMSNTSKDHLMVYADSLVQTVRKALLDPLPEVREAAALTFESLHNTVGARALEDILPHLLLSLNDPQVAEEALDGLQQVMAVKNKVVLPYLVPQLTAKPVNTRALSFLSSVAGDSLTKHLPKILPALMAALSEKAGTPEEAQELEYCRNVVLSVQDERGIRTILEELLDAAKQPSAPLSAAACDILRAFCDRTSIDYSDYRPDLFRGLICLFVRTEDNVLLAAWECLNTITKKLDVSEMLQHIQDVRQAVKFAASDLKGRKEMPGFSIPKKGIAPVLPIFREGMLNGPQDVKAIAANGLGELINLTSAEALKPSVVNITGPLIRILGDRFSAQVKVAVLETLTLLLSKVGLQLKPFLPQLQTTFLKALNDPQRGVRLKAADALGKLIVIHMRVDPLFVELLSSIKNTSDSSVRDTMLQAMRYCICGAGSKISEANRKLITSSLLDYLKSDEDATRTAAAGCLGALCDSLSDVELKDLLITNLLDTDISRDWTLKHGQAMALMVGLSLAPGKLIDTGLKEGIESTILALIGSDRLPLCQTGYRCLGFLLRHDLNAGVYIGSLLGVLLKGLKTDSNDVKQLVTTILSFLLQQCRSKMDGDTLRSLIGPLVMGSKEKNTTVKSNCEYNLVTLLCLREGDAYLNKMLPTLDIGIRDSLNDIVSKSLLKLSKQPEPPPDNIDDTVLR